MTQVQAPAPRAADQLRPVRITRGYTVYAEAVHSTLVWPNSTSTEPSA